MPKSAFPTFNDGKGKINRQRLTTKSDARFNDSPLVAEFVGDWDVAGGIGILTISALPADFFLSAIPGREVIEINGVPL
jgi:hypothetical protein